jgi:hypothetical protein
MICFHCNKTIESFQERSMIGLDVPYVNLWFHRDCFDLHVRSNIDAYLLQNIKLCYTYQEKLNNKGKNKRLWAKNE